MVQINWEKVAVVDENDKVIGIKKLSVVHSKGLFHREAYIYLVNLRHEVLLQKRADNKLWDHSSAGHFSPKEDYLQGALREFYEELGIKLDDNDLIEIGYEKRMSTSDKKINNRFIKIFLVRKEIPLRDFKIDKKEVDEVKYFDIVQLNKLMKSKEKAMTGSSKDFIQKYILNELRK